MRFSQFLKRTSDAQYRMSGGRDLGAQREAEEALGLYGLLAEKDWLSRLDRRYLTADQKQQVRETAYVTLVSLADFRVRWAGLREDPGSAARSLDLLECAQAFHEPTRAFYFVRAECRRRQGDTAAAAEDEKRFHAAAAQSAWDYYLPGHTAGWRGDLDEAIRSYKAALRLQPDHRNSLFFLGVRLFNDKNRWQEAIAYLTGSIALGPDSATAHRIRAECYMEHGQRDEAIEDWRHGIRLNPGNANVLAELGLLLGRLGKRDEAIAALRQAVSIEPGRAGEHFQLGNLLAMKGEEGEATASYFKAIENWDASPSLCNSAACNNNLAWMSACHALKLHDRAQTVALIRSAVELARRAVELAPTDGPCRSTLGCVQYLAGDWSAAVGTLGKSMELNNGGTAYDYFFLAMAHWRLGHADEALAWYDKAVVWMEKHEPHAWDLKLCRAEAEALLGLSVLPADVFAQP
jgi:tetratricopeptide (TPR) repeat protein